MAHLTGWSGKTGERSINKAATFDAGADRARQPRAIGTARVSVRAAPNGQTRIAELRQSGSSRLVFPQTFRPGLEAIYVNTAGGVTGGDVFSLEVRVEAGADLTLTTQAAERAYRAQPGETGQVTTTLDVEEGARLNWVPQELILFDRSALDRRLDISLAQTARLLMVEPVVFGRAAMHEDLRAVSFRDRVCITRAGRPVYIDGMDLCGDAAAHLARPAIANGAGAMASLIYIAPDAASQLSAVRALLPSTAGASLLHEDIMVMRHLAEDSFALRQTLMPVLDRLTGATLPTSWRL